MSVDVFLDTNILVYAVTSDDIEQAKRQRALEIIETEDFAISVRYQTSYWDGAILTAAESIGVHRLYSEDLIHGQRYGSVEAFNPFSLIKKKGCTDSTDCSRQIFNASI